MYFLLNLTSHYTSPFLQNTSISNRVREQLYLFTSEVDLCIAYLHFNIKIVFKTILTKCSG